MISKTVAGASALALGAMVAFAAPDAQANVTFSGTGTNGSDNLSASVQFALTGNDLTVVLTNSGSVTQTSSVLTAVFFNVAGNTALNPGDGIAGGCKGTAGDACPATLTDMGNGWAYKNSQNTYGANEVITAAGFGLPGTGDGNFSTGGVTLDGAAYGIVTSSTSVTGSLATPNKPPYAVDTMTFYLTVPNGFDLSSISNVTFQYGTGLSEPNVPGTTTVPIPAALPIIGAALGGFGFAGWRNKRKFA